MVLIHRKESDTLKQRRVTTVVRPLFYHDWREYLRKKRAQGYSYRELSEALLALGVRVSHTSLATWDHSPDPDEGEKE